MVWSVRDTKVVDIDQTIDFRASKPLLKMTEVVNCLLNFDLYKEGSKLLWMDLPKLLLHILRSKDC